MRCKLSVLALTLLLSSTARSKETDGTRPTRGASEAARARSTRNPRSVGRASERDQPSLLRRATPAEPCRPNALSNVRREIEVAPAWMPGREVASPAPASERSALLRWLLPQPKAGPPSDKSEVSGENRDAALPPAVYWRLELPYQVSMPRYAAHG
jgi:hypothetical protein